MNKKHEKRIKDLERRVKELENPKFCISCGQSLGPRRNLRRGELACAICYAPMV